MRKLIFIIAAVAALAPVAAQAAPPASAQAHSNAARSCKSLRTNLGPAAFATAFGSLGGCVSRVVPIEQQNVDSGNSVCLGEQSDANFAAAHGGKSFNAFYGTNDNDRNAFGKCLSQKAQASSDAEQGSMNPARTCRALRAGMGSAAFGLLYGTTANHRNAYGKCVSRVARAQVSTELNAAQQCRAQQDDPNFAAANGGKTFAQLYGSNDDLSNAFGKCVSEKATAASAKQVQATANAARACKAELKASATAFRQKYGSKVNAFGKCVAARATNG